MKNHPIHIIIILLLLFTICLTNCKYGNKNTLNQDDPKILGPTECEDTSSRAHLIELQVNTDDIDNLAKSKKWKFIGQGQNEPDSLFTTDVGPGDRVIWVGVSSSSINDKVEITKIKHVDGEQLLTKKTLTGKDGIVVGEIVHDADSGALGKYELKFKVTTKLLVASDTITIDPKLRVH